MFPFEYIQRLLLWCRCLFTWHCLRTSSLDTSYCIPFRTLSITHSSVFVVNHRISRIYTQQWISRDLFTFRPMLIGTSLFNWGWGNVCDIGFETHDIYIYIYTHFFIPALLTELHLSISYSSLGTSNKYKTKDSFHKEICFLY